MVKKSPKNSIKLNIPETLIFSFEDVITYIYTNHLGFLELKLLNDQSSTPIDPIAHDNTKCTNENNIYSHYNMRDSCVLDLIKILNGFHDKTYKNGQS